MKLVDKIVEQGFKDRQNGKKRELFLVMDNAKYNHGKLFKEHLEKITQETGIKIKVTYLPAYSPTEIKLELVYVSSYHAFLSALTASHSCLSLKQS